MTPRVPDEYFRKRASESEDVGVEETPDAPAEARPEEPPLAHPAPEGITPRLLVLIVVVALATAFVIGRLLIFTPDLPAVVPPSETPSPQASATDNFAPYDGVVQLVQPASAEGRCRSEGSRDTPEALIDASPDTIWRCKGDGVGESVTFTFEPGATLVGVRLINGNTAWTGRYPAERRLLSIRWQFADGSYFVQGLAANNRGYQEVRFPAIDTTTVTMTVEAATEPGQQNEMVDAVSVTSLEFLTTG